MKNKFLNYSSIEQTIKINELLGATESFYTLSSVFEYLPGHIDIDGVRGDRFISDYEISYSSIDSNWKLNLVKSFPIPANGDIYDAFISALEYCVECSLIDSCRV